jgi:hypothetical protein
VTQVAVVPANRQVNIVGQDIVAVVHNTSPTASLGAPTTDGDHHLEARARSRPSTAPCRPSPSAVTRSVVVDENAVEPNSPLAEASPQATRQALEEEFDPRARRSTARPRRVRASQKQEVTDLEAKANDAKAASRVGRGSLSPRQPDPRERKPNRKPEEKTTRKAGTTAKPPRRRGAADMPGLVTVPSSKVINLIGKDQAARVTNLHASASVYCGGDTVSSSSKDYTIAATANRIVNGPRWVIASTEAQVLVEELPVGVASTPGQTPTRHWMHGFKDTSTGTNTTVTANRAYVGQLNIPNRVTLTGAAYLIGTTGGTDKAVVALWDSTGKLLANSAKAGTTVGTATPTRRSTSRLRWRS